MKRYLIIPLLLLSTIVSEASDKAPEQPAAANNQYQECVAVSLFTKQGKEVNSLVNNKSELQDTNLIPEGWSVVAVTTKSDALVTSPYLVICH